MCRKLLTIIFLLGLFISSANAGTLTQILTKEWDGANWNDVTKQIFTYPIPGEMIHLTQKMDGGNWIDFMRLSYKYDNKGNPAELITETKITGSWFQTVKNIFTYTYDGNKILESVMQKEVFGILSNDTKEVYSYAGNKLDESTIYMWNGSDWDELMHNKYEYSSDLLTTVTMKMWNGSAWENFSKTENEYSNGRLTVITAKSYVGGAWVDEGRSTNSYNNDGVVSEVLREIWNGSAWEIKSKDINTYSGGVAVEFTDINLPENFLISNYPNPFNAQTNINFELKKQSNISLNICDINGRLIKTLITAKNYSAGQHSVNWDGTDMRNNTVSSGVYFYRINTDNGYKVRRCTLLK